MIPINGSESGSKHRSKHLLIMMLIHLNIKYISKCMFVTDMSYSRYKTFKHFLRNINHYISNCIHKGCPLYLSISDISNDEYSFNTD